MSKGINHDRGPCQAVSAWSNHRVEQRPHVEAETATDCATSISHFRSCQPGSYSICALVFPAQTMYWPIEYECLCFTPAAAAADARDGRGVPEGAKVDAGEDELHRARLHRPPPQFHVHAVGHAGGIRGCLAEDAG